jgi:hypothetical protein
MKQPDTVPIAVVAREVGLGVEAVEQWLFGTAVEKTDFVRRGRVIGITPLGVKKIRELAVPAPVSEVAPVPSNGAAPLRAALAEPLREDLVVSRANLSPRTVLANRPNGNEVTCLVKTTALLKPGMVLRNCQRDDYGYIYLGNLPRSLGDQQRFFPGWTE